ncbi:MAG: nitrilase-related carbon-nitrogen hydrolase, partial [Acidimicrobiia bacterium]
MTFRVAGAQMNLTVGDISGNEAAIADAMTMAAEADADMLLVPELALTGYPPEDLVHRRDFVDANLAALHRLALSATELTVIVGFVDHASDAPRGAADSEERPVANAAAILGDGGVRG